MSYIDKFLKEEPVKKPKTNIEKSLTNVAYAQKDLRDAGLDIPDPDVNDIKKRNFFEKFIVDPISSVQYGISNSIKRMYEGDAEGKNHVAEALKGFGTGFAGGWSDKHADQRASFRDSLHAIMNSGSPKAEKLMGYLAPGGDADKFREAYGDVNKSVIGTNNEGKKSYKLLLLDGSWVQQEIFL